MRIQALYTCQFPCRLGLLSLAGANRGRPTRLKEGPMGTGGPTPMVTTCMAREPTRIYADKAVYSSSLRHTTHCALYHHRHSLFDPLGQYAAEAPALSSLVVSSCNVPALRCRLRNSTPPMKICLRQSRKWTRRPTSTRFSPIQSTTIHRKSSRTMRLDSTPSQDDQNGRDGLSCCCMGFSLRQ
jgi:hypothetical protein